MKLTVAAIMILLLFGCTAQTVEEPVAEQPYEPELPDTSNITFSREPMGEPKEKYEPPTFDFTNQTDADGKLLVHFFYLPGCIACKGITPEVDTLEENYPEVVFMRYDISSVNGSYAYNSFADQYNLSRELRLVPQVLVNGTIITDRFNINESLEGLILNYSG